MKAGGGDGATASAFAPGHVSGLFAVHDEAADPLHRGSRGAGWSLVHGAWATVRRTGGPTAVRVGGHLADAPVTLHALRSLDPAGAAGWDVELRLDLPVGQGFGMSAAGTLAAALAASSLLGLEPERALQATHIAEVEAGTGLGDAVGSWFGSGEVRLRPGCPPHGWAMRIDADPGAFLFCVLGGPIATPSVIRDPAWRAATRKHGDVAVDRILEAGRAKAWTQLLGESAVFSHRLGLMPKPMADLGAKLPDGIRWGQCMLGSTMWVWGDGGDLERAEAVLEGHGQLIRSRVEPNGARLVRAVA